MWVTATGAFLVTVAAALFVAVRWDSLADQAKLGVLAALTGLALLAGERMRPALPATAGVLSHLGAFLGPLNVAAVTVHVLRNGGDPADDVDVALTATLATATAGAVLWWVLHRRRPSLLLGAASAAAVAVAAGAAGALAAVPGTLLLVATAIVASLLGARRTAVGWASVAGTAPLLAAAMAVTGLDRAVELIGLSGSTTGVATLVAGAASALVLSREAGRSRRPELLVLAATSAVTGILGWRSSVDLALTTDLVGWAAVLLAVELAVLAGRDDDFWSRPLRTGTAVVEAVAVVAFGGLAAVAAGSWALADLLDHHVRPGGPAVLATAALLVAAWLVADIRRLPDPGADRARPGWWPATVLVAVTAPLGTALGTHAALPTAVVLLAVGAWCLLADRPVGDATLVAATVVAAGLPGEAGVPGAAVLGAVGAGSVVLAARRRAAGAGLGDAGASWALAGCATLPLLVAHAGVAPTVHPLAGLVLLVVALGGMAEVLDGTPVAPGSLRRGFPARAVTGGVAVLAGLAAADPVVGAGRVPRLWEAAVVGALAVAVALLGALRTDDPRLLGLTGAGGSVAVAAGAAAGGYEPALAGVAVAAAVVVTSGLRLLLAPRWAAGLLPTVATGAGVAVLLALPDQLALGTTMVALGGVVLSEALVARSNALGAVGGGTVVVGTWHVLGALEVVALDAWAAPVALALLVAGTITRHERAANSWVAFGPAVALLGGTALAERVAGGSGSHALVVGAVGVAGVALGGIHRLGAPLVIGTLLLGALTVHESLAFTAAVPTWGWLAAGGALLMGVGVALERRDTGPFEAGQSVLDVVRRRFS